MEQPVSTVPDAGTTTITKENPLTSSNWDSRLSGFSNSSIFHTTAWASVLTQTYGFTPVYLTATRRNRLVSLLPLMEVSSWLTGTRGVSLPFTDECAVLESGSGDSQSVLNEALQVGRSRHWKYLECRAENGFEKTFSNPLPSLTFFTHSLDLQGGVDSLFCQCDSSVRRAIRKAEKSGLRIDLSRELSAVREFYALHCQTRREHGLPPQPFSFFLNIHRHILSQDLGMVISAKHNERTVAAAMFFQSGRQAIYKFGASAAAFQHLRANNLVMWEAIKHYARKGIQVLNFGRTSLTNEGLRRFKLGWGSTERQTHYYKYDIRKNGFVSDKDDTTGWHTRVFHSLPLPLSRLAGALLYKHVA